MEPQMKEVTQDWCRKHRGFTVIGHCEDDTVEEREVGVLFSTQRRKDESRTALRAETVWE
jgi:hypothetical protein